MRALPRSGALQPDIWPSSTRYFKLCAKLCEPSINCTQSKQRGDLGDVLRQTTIARLHVTELPLEDTKRVFDLGPNRRPRRCAFSSRSTSCRLSASSAFLDPGCRNRSLSNWARQSGWRRLRIPPFASGLLHQAFCRQDLIDQREHLRSQPMCFKQMAEPENRAFIRQTHHAPVETRELAIQRHVVQGLLHCRARQTAPLLLRSTRRTFRRKLGVSFLPTSVEVHRGN